MATKISWCDETINPVVGCSKASEECDKCYAENMAARLASMGHGQYQSVTSFRRWNGLTAFVESELQKPMKWKAPRSVFVCSMGDLFHKSVPFEWIDEVMRMVWDNPRHTFILLTKRPENMRRYFMGLATAGITSEASQRLLKNINYAQQDHGWHLRYLRGGSLPNLVLGVTAGLQDTFDERVPILLDTPAAKRFVSIEPLLAPVELSAFDRGAPFGVIVGGESGNKARYLNPTWVRTLRDQCEAVGISFLFKQWSDAGTPGRPWEHVDESGFPLLDGKTHTAMIWNTRKSP